MKKFLIIAGMIMCFILGGCSVGVVDAKESSSNSEYILKSNEDYIEGKETIRFTVLVWIDGYDLEATGNVPSGAGIQLSMYIALRDEFETEEETTSLVNEESGMIVLNENKNFTNIDMKNLTNMNRNFKKEVNDSEEC